MGGLHSETSSLVVTFMVLVFSWQPSFSSASTPFIFLHGLNSQCSNPRPTWYITRLEEWSKTKGYCIVIGNGTLSSWFIPLEEQVEEACVKVKAMKELSKRFNIVGLSQGNLIGRGIVEFCDGAPQVNNFISIAAPQAGIGSLPRYAGLVRAIAKSIVQAGVYSDYVQNRLAPSGYTKLPDKIPAYLKGCRFLPKLNNERPGKRNPVYKKRFSSLKNLVLIMNENDTIIKPKESSWFGFYEDGKTKRILQPRETKLYIEDWIGLRTLDEAGKVKFIKVRGAHVDMTDADIKKYVVPYLQDKRRRLANGGTQAEGGAKEEVTTTGKPNGL